MNIIVFHVESLRADLAYSPYPEGAKTPHLDRFRRQAVTFENCFAQSPFCTPSRCSMFTGLYPHVHGHRNISHLLHAHENNLFSSLKNNGYATAVYGKNDLTDGPSTRKSFDEYRRTVGPDTTQAARMEPSEPHLHKAFHHGERVCDGIARDSDWANVQSGIKFMSRHQDRPFCLLLPLVFVHPPYLAEKPFYLSHERAEIKAPIAPDFSHKPGALQDLYDFQKHGELSSDDLREIKGMYMDMISRVDYLFGELLDAVERLGLVENTTIIFTSDHGDFAGDYGLSEKWNNGTEDCLLQIPLVIRHPNCQGGTRHNGLVEGLDLYKTVLDLAGVNADHHHFSRNILAPEQSRDAVFCESGFSKNEGHAATYSTRANPNLDDFYEARGAFTHAFPQHCQRKAMIRTEHHKLVYAGGTSIELYDLHRDPDELHNLVDLPAYAHILADLERRLLNWFLETSDVTPLQPDSRTFPTD